MIEINGKYMCDGCFKELDSKHSCDCGFLNNPADSLACGTILNGRYVVGRQIRENKVVKEYVCYDSQNDSVVFIKEFFPKVFVLRSSKTIIVLDNEEDLDAYNASMQKFIKLMQIPQSLSNSECFIKVQNAFYENNTAYFVVDNHSLITVKEFVDNNRRLADKKVASIFYAAIKGLCELEQMKVFNGNISASNIYIESDGIRIDGFEPNEDDFVPYIKESMVFNRTSYYMSASDFSKKGRDIFSDVFSVGAVLYTMLTGKYPESPFECESQFDKSALETCANDKLFVEIIKKMCRIDSCSYESMNSLISDTNKIFKKYGFKEMKIKKNGSESENSSADRKFLKPVIAFIVIFAVILAAVFALVVKRKTVVPEGETTATSVSTEMNTETTVSETEL